LPPNEIRDSGFGLHAVWHLKEPVCDEAGLEQAEQVMRRLVQLLAGDPAPTHRAALLRRPGTDNFKNGEPRKCHVLEEHDRKCDIGEFEDMFDLYSDHPLLTLKETEKANGGGDNFQQVRERTPVDLEAELNGIHFGNIDTTMQRAIWSMLRKGVSADEVYRVILKALNNSPACQADPKRASWQSKIADKISRAVEADPTFKANLLSELQETWNKIIGKGERPRLSWRQDRNEFHVRGYHQRDNDASTEPPKG
jgi:hypothetical protein